MGVDLKIGTPSEPIKRTFRLPQKLSEEFNLYVEAAQENAPGATESDVIEAILKKHLSKDRGFRAWLKARKAGGQKTSDVVPARSQHNDSQDAGSDSGGPAAA